LGEQQGLTSNAKKHTSGCRPKLEKKKGEKAKGEREVKKYWADVVFTL